MCFLKGKIPSKLFKEEKWIASVPLHYLIFTKTAYRNKKLDIVLCSTVLNIRAYCIQCCALTERTVHKLTKKTPPAGAYDIVS